MPGAAEPVFVPARSPTDDELRAMLHKIIRRILKLLTRRGCLVEEGGTTYLADIDAGGDDAHGARALAPLQAAACTYRTAQELRTGSCQGSVEKPSVARWFPSR